MISYTILNVIIKVDYEIRTSKLQLWYHPSYGCFKRRMKYIFWDKEKDEILKNAYNFKIADVKHNSMGSVDP